MFAECGKHLFLNDAIAYTTHVLTVAMTFSVSQLGIFIQLVPGTTG